MLLGLESAHLTLLLRSLLLKLGYAFLHPVNLIVKFLQLFILGL